MSEIHEAIEKAEEGEHGEGFNRRIALVIAIEKLVPRGRVTARVVGTLSALAGIGFLARAAWTHGFTT